MKKSAVKAGSLDAGIVLVCLAVAMSTAVSTNGLARPVMGQTLAVSVAWTSAYLTTAACYFLLHHATDRLRLRLWRAIED